MVVLMGKLCRNVLRLYGVEGIMLEAVKGRQVYRGEMTEDMICILSHGCGGMCSEVTHEAGIVLVNMNW